MDISALEAEINSRANNSTIDVVDRLYFNISQIDNGLISRYIDVLCYYVDLKLKLSKLKRASNSLMGAELLSTQDKIHRLEYTLSYAKDEKFKVRNALIEKEIDYKKFHFHKYVKMDGFITLLK